MFDEKINCPNCEAFDKCSIVGTLPVAYDCSYYKPTIELEVPLPAETMEMKVQGETLEPIKTTIEGGVLKVVIKKGDKKVPLYIDLDQHL